MRSATLEHCHDFRAPSSRVEKGDNYAHTVLYSEKRPKGLKKFVRCYCCLTLYNTNGHSQQTWICFSHIYNFYLQPRCADFAKNLAKIDTEMLIPEGRKLPLKVVWQKREEFWQLFQKKIKQKKDQFSYTSKGLISHFQNSHLSISESYLYHHFRWKICPDKIRTFSSTFWVILIKNRKLYFSTRPRVARGTF